jgi:hypothetical protein
LKIDQELQNKIKKLARELNIDGLLPKIYELALLRVLARIAEGSLGLTRSVNDDYVAVPFGLVAVFWLRQFKPVLQASLPQIGGNFGTFRPKMRRLETVCEHLTSRVKKRIVKRQAPR